MKLEGKTLYLVTNAKMLAGSGRIVLATTDLKEAVAEYNKDSSARELVATPIEKVIRVEVCTHCGRSMDGQ